MDDQEKLHLLFDQAEEQQKLIEELVKQTQQQQKQINELIDAIPETVQQGLGSARKEHEIIVQEHQQLLEKLHYKARQVVDWRFLLYTSLVFAFLFTVTSIGIYQFSSRHIGEAWAAQDTTKRFGALNAAYLGECRQRDGGTIVCVSVDLDQGKWTVDGHQVRALKTK